MKATSAIIIQFPATITLTAGSCTLQFVTSPMSTVGSTCTVANNAVTIASPFGSSGTFTGGSPSFTFIFETKGTMTATDNIGDFTVSTNTVISYVNYAIDKGVFTKSTLAIGNSSVISSLT